MATSTSLIFQIFSRYDGSGVRQARSDINDFDSSTTKSTNNLNSWAGRIALATQGALAFGPALIPIGAAAVAAGAGLASMAGVAGVALGAYGIALEGAIAKTNQMIGAHQQLDPVQKTFTTNVNAMYKAMDNVVKSTMDVTLKAAGTAAQGATNIIKLMPGVIQAIAPVVQNVADSFKRWTEDGSLKSYIDLIKSNAVPALQGLVTIGKNVAAVLGDGFRAFLPVGQQVIRMLAEGSSNLKAWADGGGFQRFIDYVRQNSGQITDFFKALGGALKNVGEAMAGLSSPSLILATALLQIVAAMPPSVIQAIAVAFVVWRTAMQGMMIVQALVGFIGALAAASAAAAAAQTDGAGAAAAWAAALLGVDVAALPLILTIGLIVVALAALAIGIYELVTHWSTVWNAMKTAAQAVWTALQVAWAATVAALKTAWDAVSGAMVTAWNATWNALRMAGTTVWNALKAAWQAVVQAFSTTWTAVSSALVTAWNATWNALRTAGTAVWNALKAAWQAVVQAFSTVWTTVSNALKTAWQATWTGLQTAATAVWNALKAAWQAVVQAFSTVWTTVSNALKTSWQTVWNGLKTAAQAVWTAMQTAWKTFLTAIQTAWTTVSNALKTAWQTVWNALKTAAQAVWTAMKTAWTTFLNAIKTAWDTVSAALKAAWQAAWEAIKTAATTIWDALKGLWQTFLDAVKQIWDTASSALKTAWSDTWNALKDAASKIWDEIKGVIEKAVNAVIGIINGLIGAWNAVAGAVGLPKIGSIGNVGGGGDSTPSTASGGTSRGPGGTSAGGGFAYGGVTPGAGPGTGGVFGGYSPGRDSIPAMYSPGEGVLVPEAVQGLGTDFVYGANHYFSGGRAGYPTDHFAGLGFAKGGIVGGGLIHFAGGGFPSEIPAPDPNNPDKTSGTVGQTPGKNEGGGAGTNPVAGLGSTGEAIVKGAFGLPSIASVTAAFMKWINAARGIGGWASGVGGKVAGVGEQMLQKIVSAIQAKIAALAAAAAAKAKSLLGSLAGGLSGAVGNLAALASKALAAAGLPQSELGAFLALIQAESSGNPNAINLTDINARAGNPSVGLAQVTLSNFATYGPGGSPYDPLGNLIASANYSKATYGGIPLHSPYAMGTLGASEGWHLVGEQGPEMVHLRGGDAVSTAHDTSRFFREGGGGNPVHVEMPIHVAGNLDKHAVEKLDNEVLPKLRIMLSKGTGSRLS